MRQPNARTAWEIVVVGSAGSAYLARGPLPNGQKRVRAERLYEEIGGKGATQALAAARLGGRVALVACIGEDRRGEELLARLESEGVSTRFMVRDPYAPTAAEILLSSQQEGTRSIVIPGASEKLSAEHVNFAMEPLQAAKILLAPLDAPLPAIVTAAKLAKQAGLKVILDAAPNAQAPNSLLSLADLVTADADGAFSLTGLAPCCAVEARKVATNLLERGATTVAVEAGDDGELLAWPGGERLLPRLSLREVDTSCGQDAFAAGMAIALLDGRAVSDAGLFAQMVAALARSEVGAHASLPVREIVMEALARV